MEYKVKCACCGNKNLKEIDISGPTDDGFYSLNKTNCGTICSFLCEDCGYINLYLKSKMKKEGEK